jgi:hypothetical protein
MDAFDLNPTTAASDSLSIGALAVDPANPDRLYVGSGEGDGAAYFGVGPIVTANGGANAPTWTTESTAPGSPSLAGSAFYALAVDPRTQIASWRRRTGGRIAGRRTVRVAFTGRESPWAGSRTSS